jgi:pimeloyl-ACP methyl ester carboxylesterase
MPSQIARTSKGTIEYTRMGTGPVLLIRHATSQDCPCTQAFEPLINEGFSLLTPSRPGLDVGRSNVQAAEALIALLEGLNIPKCSVIAASGGGPTGIALAANFPKRVKHLVLMVTLSGLYPITMISKAIGWSKNNIKI